MEASPQSPDAEPGPLDVVEVLSDAGDKPRKKYNTKDKSPRARVGMWLAMRSLDPTLTNKDIADRLGISAQSLKNVIYRANKEGWLKFTDPLDRLEFGIIPKVVDNLDYFLDQRDKTVTVETAKGTIFHQYKESKTTAPAATTMLALKIELPEPGQDIKVAVGQIVGKPRGLLE